MISLCLCKAKRKQTSQHINICYVFGFFRVMQVFCSYFQCKIFKTPWKLLSQKKLTEKMVTVVCFYWSLYVLELNLNVLPCHKLFWCLISYNVLRPIILTEQVLVCLHVFPFSVLSLPAIPPHVDFSNMLAFWSAVIPTVLKFVNSLLLFGFLESFLYRKIRTFPTRCQKLCQSIGQVKIEFLRQMAEVCLHLNVVEIFF